MNRIARNAFLAASLSISAVAFAQAPAAANPVSRGGADNTFYYAPLQQTPTGGMNDPFANAGLGRPAPRSGVQVTPVPEPSQWAMMLAGLALVGFIVRRSSKRS